MQLEAQTLRKLDCKGMSLLLGQGAARLVCSCSLRSSNCQSRVLSLSTHTKKVY